jgi:hypothetical protein
MAKGVIKADHIAVNNYLFLIVGAPKLTITEISGIEEELEKTELPDRTVASGGNTKPLEFTIKTPMHHPVEMAFLELWFRMGQDPVLPGYKMPVVLQALSISGKAHRSYSLFGVFLTKRSLPSFDMHNEGEVALIEWGVSADSIMPLPV